jgi:hypothetical protein
MSHFATSLRGEADGAESDEPGPEGAIIDPTRRSLVGLMVNDARRNV